MTEVEMTLLLQELSQTAKTLNRDSDSVNELIAQLEDTLSAFNIGLEVWYMQESVESRSRWIEGDFGSQFKNGTIEVELGYAKERATDEWHLMLREAAYEKDKDDEFENTVLYDVSNTQRLLDAPRKHRIRALALMPGLLGTIKREAEEAIKTIEAAKKILK